MKDEGGRVKSGFPAHSRHPSFSIGRPEEFLTKVERALPLFVILSAAKDDMEGMSLGAVKPLAHVPPPVPPRPVLPLPCYWRGEGGGEGLFCSTFKVRRSHFTRERRTSNFER